MHSTRCLLGCVGAWGCCACRLPSAQRLRSNCTHPSSRRAASAGWNASATPQWVAAGLVLSRRCSEWSSRGGIGVLTRGISSTLLVFLVCLTAIFSEFTFPFVQSHRPRAHLPQPSHPARAQQSPRHHPRPHTHPVAAALAHTHEQLHITAGANRTQSTRPVIITNSGVA
ncbi:hypothetical protein TcCL_Unassigned03622 [Trypanosoma cruzi]|nr:hypothetical protein TcCL_Unassigned03622 [Trypanosoma cruzi]